MLRVILGFIVCAALLPLVALLGATGADLAEGIAYFTVSATVLVGFPLFIWFRKCRWFAVWQWLIAGTAAGALASIPLLFFKGLGGGWWQALVLPFLGIGAAHGLIFWLIAIFRNQVLPR